MSKNHNGKNEKTVIDWDQVSVWLMKGSKGTDICKYLGISETTIYERCFTDTGLGFREFSQKSKAKGDTVLHGTQFDKAVGGDTSMLIWLGKNRMGQKDKHETQNNVSITYEKVDYSKAIDDAWDPPVREDEEDHDGD